MNILTVDDLLAALVDDLALLVHHFVVLEDVLADLGVARLHGVLGALDRLRHHLGFDGLVFGHGAVHDPRHGAGREQSQQVVFEGEVEAALTRVALASRTTAQLIVDAPRVVSLGAEHVEATERANFVALGFGDGLPLRGRGGNGRLVLRRSRV